LIRGKHRLRVPNIPLNTAICRPLLDPDQDGHLRQVSGGHEQFGGGRSGSEFTFRFRYEKGSIAFWDNRSTKHIALGDTGPFRRLMRRVQISGDKPV
jgi:alpha-ketoglutarate-dependent taurine dioxygenase